MAGKIKKENKAEQDQKMKEEIYLDDEDIPLSERIGTSPELIDKTKKVASDNLKQTKLNFKPVTKPKVDDVLMEIDDDSNDVTVLDDDVNGRGSSNSNSKASSDAVLLDDDLGNFVASTSDKPSNGKSSKEVKSKKAGAKEPKEKKPRKPREPKEKKEKPAAKKKKTKKGSDTDDDDDDFMFDKKEKPAAKKKKSKKGSDTEDDDDDFMFDKKEKPAAKKKSKKGSDTEEDDFKLDDDTEDFAPIIPKERTKRAAAGTVKSKYVFDSESDEDDDFVASKKKKIESDDEFMDD